ncbi:MAG: peptidase [Bryobacterales bacterium]|nr:peptidase [Bryobacterales bacterium]
MVARLVPYTVLALLFSSALRAQALPPAVKAAEKSISADRIRAHVRFLASDLLEGRAPGQRGGELAAEYIATQFMLDGLKPAGDGGTFFQRVPLAGVTTVPEGTTLALVPASGQTMSLRLGDDFVSSNQTLTDSADIDAPIVWAGYGIEAPEYGWDDFKGVDVRGKVLLVLVNEPASSDEKFFKGKALTYYGRWTYKFEEAARKGAVGVLIIHRTDLASYGWDVVRNSWSGEHDYLRNDPLAKLKAASWIQLDVANRLFAAAGLDAGKEIEAAGKRGFTARELPVRLKAHIVDRVRRFDSTNVVGILPGANATGRDQAVMYTAHYDHFGIGPSKTADHIYNGAADNGTGCGILLELANVFSHAAIRPPHSVIFASVTAEEQGLLGSEYLGMHPPVPAAQISLDLNYDMLLPIGDPLSAELNGAERTTFYPQVQATAKEFHLAIEPDANPMAGHYYRSDHFSLARVGIPAFSVGEGTQYAGRPAGWGQEQYLDFNKNRYHQPSDEYSPTMDFTGNAKLAKFGFVLGWQALEAKSPVQWQPGDEFEAARKASMQAGK